MTNPIVACLEDLVLAKFPTREAAIAWLDSQDDEFFFHMGEESFCVPKGNVSLLPEQDHKELYK